MGYLQPATFLELLRRNFLSIMRTIGIAHHFKTALLQPPPQHYIISSHRVPMHFKLYRHISSYIAIILLIVQK